MANIWSFVEKFYPNYHGCDKISLFNDLSKLRFEEPLKPGDSANQLLENKYDNDINHANIETDYARTYVRILELAIENYLTVRTSLLTVPDNY